jgi:hypothetical protein
MLGNVTLFIYNILKVNESLSFTVHIMNTPVTGGHDDILRDFITVTLSIKCARQLMGMSELLSLLLRKVLCMIQTAK